MAAVTDRIRSRPSEAITATIDMKAGGKCVHKQTESRSDIKERRKRADGTFS